MSLGTLAINNNSDQVAGTGTSFTVDLKINDFIAVPSGGVTYTMVVKAIASDTALTLTRAFSGPNVTGANWAAIPAGTMVGVTAKIADDTAYTMRMYVNEATNWMNLLTVDGDVTVYAPDGSSYTGPSWLKLGRVMDTLDITALTTLAAQIHADASQVATDTATTTTNKDTAVQAATTATTAAQTATTAAGTATTKAGEASASAVTAKNEADRAATANPDNQLKKANNLSDVDNKAIARQNLGLAAFYTTGASGDSRVLNPANPNQYLFMNASGVWGAYDLTSNQNIALTISYGGTGGLMDVQGEFTTLASPDKSKQFFIRNDGSWGVTIPGGDVQALGVSYGGTGAKDVAGARSSLGLDRINQVMGETYLHSQNKDLVFIVQDTGNWGYYQSSLQNWRPLGINQGGTGVRGYTRIDVADAGALNFQLKPYGQIPTSFRNEKTIQVGNFTHWNYSPSLFIRTGDTYSTLCIPHEANGPVTAWIGSDSNGWLIARTFWDNFNTTVDANGFIKKASPIVKLKGDGTADLNEEAEGVTVERLGVGVYKVSGVLGFHSDPAWSGIDGGYSIPQNGNGLPLLWVDYSVEANGYITLRTYHRTHPTAPSFASNLIGIKDEEGNFTETVKEAEPVDIPNGRWIDLRVEMPSDSIYNLKIEEMRKQAEKAEAERKLAEEEERRKQEEALASDVETSEPEDDE